ncbi:hypothetical protein APHAL10511_007556 [Amanita phalloides]|nr:hypothetical protein APHAL10511_007556 [Amanita phalloides]
MSSYLETLPSDILQHIAFLTSSDFALGPPNDLLALMLTSSRLYQCLNVHASPHLYANLFRTRFDFSSICCPWRIGLADSVGACHFIQRFRALRRAKTRDMSSVQLCEDLRATLWMAIENDDVNEKYLSSVDFPGYAIELARHYLNGCENARLLQDEHEINSLVVCLLCYVFTREKLMATPREIREELLNLLRPLTCSSSMFRKLLYRCNHYSKRQDGYNSRDAKTSSCPLIEQPVNHVARDTILDPALETQILCPSSAIILTFAIKEIVPLVIPPHLPETRAAALAANRSGPTLVDFQATIRCNTPLFADTCAEAEWGGKTPFFSIGNHSARLHDPELHRLVRADSKFSIFQTLPYIPGSLSGVWEGSYLISSLRKPSVNAVADFSCRKPMQCAMSEFLCYSPHQPLPFGVFDISPRSIHVTENGLNTCSRNYCYEKFVSGADSSYTRENHREALDILLLGETLEDHEQAWGGYRFVGRVRRDGRIFFKREPKNPEDDVFGSWYFVGHVRYGSAFVGQWRSSSFPDRVQGIFSMHKTRDTW